MKAKKRSETLVIGPNTGPIFLNEEPNYDTDLLRRRIALDQRRSPVVTGEERERWWDTIPMASTHEQSLAIACPALLAGELW